MKIKCIDQNSEFFPLKLKMLEKCPKQIFVYGNEGVLSEFSLAVIGSRKCSILGKAIAHDIGGELARNNITIVSGLARGIDTIAHNVCIENKSKTIAVLGGGHGKIYPRENLDIIHRIVENSGAVISEYPLEYPALPNNFRERNRIIAALSDGIILIEAQKNSGSLITIKYGKKLNKKIFAVPGCLDNELYEGSNIVLCEGAYCIRNTNDIYEKYNNLTCLIKKAKKENYIIDENLKGVYSFLSYTPTNLEEICAKSAEPLNKVMSKLTLLEMAGVITRIEGQNFVKTRKRKV